MSSCRGFSCKDFWENHSETTPIREYIEQIKYIRVNVPSLGVTTCQFELMKLALDKILPIVSGFSLPSYCGKPLYDVNDPKEWAGDTSIGVREGFRLATQAIEQSTLDEGVKHRLNLSVKNMTLGDWSNTEGIVELFGIFKHELVELANALAEVTDVIRQSIVESLGDRVEAKPDKRTRRKCSEKIRKVITGFIERICAGCRVLLADPIGGMYASEPCKDGKLGLYMVLFVDFLRDSFRYPGDKYDFKHNDPVCKVFDAIELLLLRVHDFFTWLHDKHRFSVTNMETLYVSREYYDNNQDVGTYLVIVPRGVDDMYTELFAIFYRERDVFRSVADEFEYEDLKLVKVDEHADVPIVEESTPEPAEELDVPEPTPESAEVSTQVLTRDEDEPVQFVEDAEPVSEHVEEHVTKSVSIDDDEPVQFVEDAEPDSEPVDTVEPTRGAEEHVDTVEPPQEPTHGAEEDVPDESVENHQTHKEDSPWVIARKLLPTFEVPEPIEWTEVDPQPQQRAVDPQTSEPVDPQTNPEGGIQVVEQPEWVLPPPPQSSTPSKHISVTDAIRGSVKKFAKGKK